MTTTKTELHYSDVIDLPGEITLAEARSIEEFLRGVGLVRKGKGGDPHALVFVLTVEGDLWDLREAVSDVEVELASRGITYHADRANIETGEQA